MSAPQSYSDAPAQTPHHTLHNSDEPLPSIPTSNLNVNNDNNNNKSSFTGNRDPATTGTRSATANPSTGGTEESKHHDDDYPEQKHAGKVGYGPNYNQAAGFGDKVTGLKEELVGKVTNKPELAEHGHDLRTGALKRKEAEEANGTNDSPFKDAKDKGIPAPTPAPAKDANP